MVTDYDADPVFLVAAERSGTTMLRLMLDNHPEIAFFSEFEFAVEQMSGAGDFPEVDSYREWLKTNRLYLSSSFRADPSLGYRDLVRSFLEQKQNRDRKPYVGATVHRNFDRLVYIWPNARYIHLLRDPRDVANSTIPMGWAGNVWMGAGRWLKAEATWSRLRERLPRDRWIELQYESLVREPEGRLKEVCEFLGVPYNPQMLEYPSTTSYAAPDPRLANRWEQALSEREVGLVEQRVGNLLVECGYAPSGVPPVVVSPLMESRLRRQDWLARVRFRIKSYGLLLFVAEFASRRLGLGAIHAGVMLKVHAITLRHLR